MRDPFRMASRSLTASIFPSTGIKNSVDLITKLVALLILFSAEETSA